ncbi:hypothetical protein C3942_10185 [Solimonas fluminis]|uniref:Outer membrane protein beta-barrel domain-containing protein n=1 Tax=Solimonas fluminis TaxID=2086571 RepID=A0A2S5TFQ4_9GAMM|nr:hypothetical protein [Solimonas fluminis]PPE73772.1 hypothetical protein C3942_10185 [Solimonas fluminis]
MRNILKTAGLALACGLVAGPALAQRPPSPPPAPAAPQPGGFGFVLGGSLEFGGDDVATVLFTNGEEQDVKAGQGLGVDAGVYCRFAGAPFSLRGTVGFKYVTTQAENADINMRRVPLQLVGSYHLDGGARMGLGLVRHNGVKFDADGIGEDIEFDDATGYTVEIGWKWILLSYTGIEYTDEFGNDYSGDSFGLKLIAEF